MMNDLLIEKFSIELDNGNLFFKSFSPKNILFPTPIICIHGLTGNLLSFERVASFLAERGHKVYTYDLRGRGGSSKEEIPYSAESHSLDLKKALEKFSDNKFQIIGHSLGAWVGLYFAKEFPWLVDKLVLIDGAGITDLQNKWTNLQMVRASLERIGKSFTSPEDYFQHAKQSKLVEQWNKDLESLLRYELVKVDKSWHCNIPKFVAESELQSLGGSITNRGLLQLIFFHFTTWLSVIKKNKNLPYQDILASTLIIRALKPTLKGTKPLVSDKSLSTMLRKIPLSRSISIPDKNHYGILLDSCPTRDIELAKFLENESILK